MLPIRLLKDSNWETVVIRRGGNILPGGFLGEICGLTT